MISAPRILIVDDDRDMCQLIRRSLAHLGCECKDAYDGWQALEQIETGQFDLVILDLMLPGPDGMEILRHIHQRQIETDVIVLTAYASLESAIEAIRMGAHDYITKPFSAVILHATVEQVLEKRQSEARLTAVYNLSREIVLFSDVKRIGEAVLTTIKQVLEFQTCSLGLIDEERNEIYWPVTCGSAHVNRVSLDNGKGITAAAVQSGEPLYVPDVREDPRYIEMRKTTRSELAVPLEVQGRVIGVLNIESDKVDAFSPHDIKLLSILASQVAVAIENTRLHEERLRRTAELAALNRTGRILTSILDLDTVLALVMAQVRSVTGAEAASVLLHDADSNELVFAASSGPASEQLMGMRMPSDSGIAGWTMQKGQPVLVHDALADPRFYDQINARTNTVTRSLLAAPLIYKGSTIGVLEAINSAAGVFDENDLSLLATLADSAAIAIENARLHEEAQRRLAEAYVLREVMIAGASTLDFDQVLDRTIQAIHRMLDIDYLVFALPDESGEHMVVHSSLIGFASPSHKYLNMPMAESVCGRVYITGRSELVDDVSGGAHYFEETVGLRSLLSVPVRERDRVIATLNVGDTRAGAFDEDDLRLFEAIAAQLSIVMDNARLYEIEREQRKLMEQSRLQLIQSEKLAATGRLAASLAHEINNPLQAVYNSLQLMLSFPLEPDERQEYLQIASEEVKRLIGLVTRMLDFARRPRQKMELTDLNDVIEKVLTLTHKYMQHHHITLQRDLAPDLPAVLGNGDELGQVFLNILLNGVDAMPDGGTLYISSQHTADGQVTVAITDTGRGIPPDHLRQVFEPFFSTKEHGTGLGLSISYNIIKQHGGEITVQSTEGEGTTFTIWLPKA